MYNHVLVRPNLASGTPAVVGKRRGRKSSPQDCDKETAKSQIDSKIQQIKKPLQ